MNLAIKLVLGVGAIIAFIFAALLAVPAQAEYIDKSPDCDNYSVMYCGSFTKKEVLKKLKEGDGKNSAKNIRDIYEKFNLSYNKIEDDLFVKGVVYRDGTVRINGKVVATKAETYIRSMGRVSTSKMGSAQEAIVSIDKKTGKFLYAIMTPCGNPVRGVPKIPPKQSIACDAINVKIINNDKREVSVKVSGSAKNTKITGYKINFGDGNTVNKQESNHTYAKYGKYTITAYVKGSVYGDSKTVTSDACKKTIEFKEPPKPESILCNALQVTIVNKTKREVTAKVTGSAKNTTITGYKLDFGDNTVVNKQSSNHTYANYGKYTIKGYVSGKVDGKQVEVTNANCTQVVEFKEPPKPQEALTCDMLSLSIVNKEKREVTAKVTGSAKNTTITGYKLDFGDGSVVNKQSSNHTYGDYGKYTVTGYVTGQLNGSSKTVTSASCKQVIEFEKPEPKPESITCDALNTIAFNKETRYVEVKVTGSAKNTTITGYKLDFGDGNVVNKQTASNTFDYGTYTIKGYVTGKVDGKTVTVSGPSCEKVVEFEKPEPKPESITCDALTLDLFNQDKRYVKVTATGTANNTSISGYEINFGDGSSPALTQTAEHTYGEDGSYTITAYVLGTVDGKEVRVSDDGCVKKVSFKEYIQPCPTNPALPIDDPNCKPCPTNPELNYDDPNCVEPVEIPNTGAGAIVGLFSGASIIGAVSHRLWAIRRMQ